MKSKLLFQYLVSGEQDQVVKLVKNIKLYESKNINIIYLFKQNVKILK